MNSLLNVINEGFCIGCGACAACPGSEITIKTDENQQLVADLDSVVSLPDSVARVCPFSDDAVDESDLAEELFGNEHCWDGFLGYHLSNYAGYVQESDFRERGSSGGLGTWILAELLREGKVDSVIHVGSRLPEEKDQRLFEYQISRDVESLRGRAKSRYHPIEFSKAIAEIKETGESVAIVGIPCFIKAIRLMCREDAALRNQIRFTVSLVCGHLKSVAFAQMFAWQVGIAPDELLKFDFRVKLTDKPPNLYGITAESSSSSQTRCVDQLFGSGWGLGFFKYKACDYCDDVFGETADVTVGDAWLPEYKDDFKGTNIVVVRNREIQQLLNDGINSKRLNLKQIGPEKAVESQTSGVRHRREGLMYRCRAKDSQRKWRPKKRLDNQRVQFDSDKFKMFLAREELAEISHVAFREAIEKNDYSHFEECMAPVMARYYRAKRGSFLRRLKRLILRKLGFASQRETLVGEIQNPNGQNKVERQQ